jgi:hypothetical protein
MGKSGDPDKRAMDGRPGRASIAIPADTDGALPDFLERLVESAIQQQLCPASGFAE